jgi:hypothetical protein
LTTLTEIAVIDHEKKQSLYCRRIACQMQVFIINVKKVRVSILSPFLIFFFFSEDSVVILVHKIKGVIGNKMYKIVKQLNMHQVLCFGAPS